MSRKWWVRGLVALVAGSTAFLAWATHGFIPAEPEVSNIGDLEQEHADSGVIEEDFPVSYVSDPRLSRPTAHVIQESYTYANEATPNLAYFIQLSDGRWSAGSTDAEGRTHPIYTESKQHFEIYLDEEAVEKWHEHTRTRTARRKP